MLIYKHNANFVTPIASFSSHYPALAGVIIKRYDLLPMTGDGSKARMLR